jgi:hypothetical protein
MADVHRRLGWAANRGPDANRALHAAPAYQAGPVPWQVPHDRQTGRHRQVDPPEDPQELPAATPIVPSFDRHSHRGKACLARAQAGQGYAQSARARSRHDQAQPVPAADLDPNEPIWLRPYDHRQGCGPGPGETPQDQDHHQDDQGQAHDLLNAGAPDMNQSRPARGACAEIADLTAWNGGS